MMHPISVGGLGSYTWGCRKGGVCAVGNDKVNKGLIAEGHATITVDNLAIGYKARAIKNVTAAQQTLDNKGLDELRQRLDELVAAVNEQAPALPDGRDVVTATEGVAAQLADPNPNKFVLTTLLDGLASKVQSATTLAVAVSALRAAVGSFL